MNNSSPLSNSEEEEIIAEGESLFLPKEPTQSTKVNNIQTTINRINQPIHHIPIGPMGTIGPIGTLGGMNPMNPMGTIGGMPLFPQNFHPMFFHPFYQQQPIRYQQSSNDDESEYESDDSSKSASDDSSESNESNEEQQIITPQKESQLSLLKKQHEILLKKFNKKENELKQAKEEVENLKRKFEQEFRQSKSRKFNNQKHERMSIADLIGKEPQSLYIKPTSANTDTSIDSNNTKQFDIIKLYSYKVDDKSPLRTNPGAVFIDIDWSKIPDGVAYLCVFISTTDISKINDSDMLGVAEFLPDDGENVKLKNTRAIFKHFTPKQGVPNHIKYFLQFRNKEMNIDYTDKVMIYSKPKENDFEPLEKAIYSDMTNVVKERFVKYK